MVGAAVLLLSCAAAAQEQDWSALADTAVAKFDARDIELMVENAKAVAERSETPSSGSWQNEATGHSGKAESLRSFAGPADVSCKTLRVTNVAGERRGVKTYTVCRFAACGWRVVPREYVDGSRPTPPGDPCLPASGRKTQN
jgi:hypothetical protein